MLRTREIYFRHRELQNVELTLMPILHVGEKSFFEYLQRRSANFDVILYELITSRNNSVLEGGAQHRRSLTVNVRSIAAEKLALQFNFSTQLDMDLRQPKWFIADLPSEEVLRLENAGKEVVLQNYFSNRVAGRGGYNPKKSITSGTEDLLFVVVFRLFLWLTPCPEMSLILIDWTRLSPNTGGISKMLYPILECIITGNLFEAKKIAFARHIMSGLSDSGSYGGEAKSDISVRVAERNKACCDSISAFVLEQKKKQGSALPFKIGVMYGVYHMEDLYRRLTFAGFDSVETEIVNNVNEPIPPVWTMTYPDIFNSFGVLKLFRQISTATFAFLFYLTLDTLDWLSVIKCLVLSDFITQKASAILSVLSGTGIVTTESLHEDAQFVALAFQVIYISAYVQRHEWFRTSLSETVVEWDKSLYEDCLK